MSKEVRGHSKANGMCDFGDCHSKHITLKLTTFRDSGEHDRDMEFCSESHCVSFLILFSHMEEQGWKRLPSKKEEDEMEALVEEIIDQGKD